MPSSMNWLALFNSHLIGDLAESPGLLIDMDSGQSSFFKAGLKLAPHLTFPWIHQRHPNGP